MLSRLNALAALLLLMTACGSSGGSGGATASSASGGASGQTATVWLCRPGTTPDPCASNLDVTSVAATGARTVTDAGPAPDPAFDCFYVYPTVSTQSTDNANLQIQAGEIGAAMSQAAPFSQVCRVWAPMYRQRTEDSLAKGLGADPQGNDVAYASVLAGWTDYLDHYNDGRPVIFIGHSQGAAMLIRLLRSQIDGDAQLRGQMVTAIIAGGNVAVPTGELVGSTFQHLPLCAGAGQTGCVIAYSTFPGLPPAGSQFGRPGQGVSLQSGQTATAGVQVACVNPAALGGGAGALLPWFVAAGQPALTPALSTPWVTYPDLYQAACHSAEGATWLQVDDVAHPGDSRPTVSETLGPLWGFHLDDINLATGNLVADVAAQENAYRATHA